KPGRIYRTISETETRRHERDYYISGHRLRRHDHCAGATVIRTLSVRIRFGRTDYRRCLRQGCAFLLYHGAANSHLDSPGKKSWSLPVETVSPGAFVEGGNWNS